MGIDIAFVVLAIGQIGNGETRDPARLLCPQYNVNGYPLSKGVVLRQVSTTAFSHSVERIDARRMAQA